MYAKARLIIKQIHIHCQFLNLRMDRVPDAVEVQNITAISRRPWKGFLLFLLVTPVLGKYLFLTKKPVYSIQLKRASDRTRLGK